MHPVIGLVRTAALRGAAILGLLVGLGPLPTTAQAQSVLTIPYLDVPDGDPDLTSLDIYPTDEESAPVMMFVHGGGWQGGDKAQIQRTRMPDVFRQAGYILVSINYRLSPAVDFPTQAEDVAAAVAWVRANIADYGGDPTRLYLMGHSAGAHLVVLIGTDARYLAAHNRLPTDLSGVIGLDTQAYDLTALADARGGRLPDVFAEVFGQERDFWAFASPITYVTEGAALPPFLLPYNSRGLRSRTDINETLASALRGVDAVAYTLPVERIHPQFVREFGAADDPVAPAVLAFAADPAAFDPTAASPGSP